MAYNSTHKTVTHRFEIITRTHNITRNTDTNSDLISSVSKQWQLIRRTRRCLRQKTLKNQIKLPTSNKEQLEQEVSLTNLDFDVSTIEWGLFLPEPIEAPYRRGMCVLLPTPFVSEGSLDVGVLWILEEVCCSLSSRLILVLEVDFNEAFSSDKLLT